MNDNLSLFSNKIHLDFRPYSIQNCSNVIVELTQLGLSFLFVAVATRQQKNKSNKIMRTKHRSLWIRLPKPIKRVDRLCATRAL